MTTKMRSEIAEQPEALRATLDSLLPRVDEVRELGERTRQLLFIARGTSDNAAVYGRYLCEPRRAGWPRSPPRPWRRRTSALDLDGVLAVAISQSGRTEEIVETLAWAKGCGATTVGVTNGGRTARSPRPPTSPSSRWRATSRRSPPRRPTPPSWPRSPSSARPRRRAWTRRPEPVPDAVQSASPTPGGLDAVVEGLADSHRPWSPAAAGLLHRAGARAQAQGGVLRHGHRACPTPTCCTGRSPWSTPDTPALLVAAGERPGARPAWSRSPTADRRGRHVYGIGGDDGARRCVPGGLPGTDAAGAPRTHGADRAGPAAGRGAGPGQGIDPDAPRGLRKVTQTDSGP